MKTDNPILHRVNELIDGGHHIESVRVSALETGSWSVRIVLDDFGPPGTTMDGMAEMRRNLPKGVRLGGFERFPDDVTQVRGSQEAIETWIAEVAADGGAPDWCRFDPRRDRVEGYPAFLTKPTKWKRPIA